MSTPVRSPHLSRAEEGAPIDRLALHHIAGLSAGASIELSPGQWDFGPASGGVDRLCGGDPPEVDFTLTVDPDLTAWLEPGSQRVRLDDQPVVERVRVGSHTIWAGASRFMVGATNQARVLPIPAGTRRGALNPWITDAIPEPIMGSRGGLLVEELVELRRRLHPGIVDVGRFAARGGGSVWFRPSDDSQFGMAAVGVANMALDMSRRSAGRTRTPFPAVPVSVDLLRRPTVVIGSRRQQLALVAQLVLNCAVTTHPELLQFGLDSDRPDLSFIRELPHWAGATLATDLAQSRRIMVVDRTGQSSSRSRSQWPRPTDGGSLLVLGRRGDPIPVTANVLTIGSNGLMAMHTTIDGSDGIRMTAGVTPIGVSPSMARDLADRLARHGG